MAAMATDHAPRCPDCCEHGQPLVGPCLWCEDVNEGHDDPIAEQDQQWLCPHGIGEDIWAGPAEGSRP
jgi:hypothetical protein